MEFVHFCWAIFFLVPRPEEVEFNNATDGQITSNRQEGEDLQDNKQYIKALPTILELTRTFETTGFRYSLSSIHKDCDQYLSLNQKLTNLAKLKRVVVDLRGA